MLMLNQNALVNIGEDKCMTLLDIEALEENQPKDMIITEFKQP